MRETETFASSLGAAAIFFGLSSEQFEGLFDSVATSKKVSVYGR